MIVLFDTCVILDYLLDRTPYADDAEELMIRVSAEEIKGLITVKSLMDIHYVLKHALHNEKQTRNAINTLLDSFVLADSASEDAVRALSSDLKDFEDALMAETAEACGCEYIVTRNKKDFKNSTVPAITPKGFLNRI